MTVVLPEVDGLPDAGAPQAELRRWLHGLPGVDEAGAHARVDTLASRAVTGAARRWALDLAIRVTDLTTLEGADTPGSVRALAARAVRPDGTEDCPRVAAVCVYPDLVAVAATALAGTGVKVAAVATAFPSGRAPRDVKLAEVRAAVAAGADEIDMVIDRGAFLTGRYGAVLEEIVAVREACGSVQLKVICENGELGTLDNVRRASWLALLGGADFVKTSTGKITPGATRAGTLVMLQAVRDHARVSGRAAGVKVAGGVRTADDAIGYLVLAHEVAGPQWLDAARLRIGASGLLTDVLRQRAALRPAAADVRDVAGGA